MQCESAVRATKTTVLEQPLLALTALAPTPPMTKLLLIGRSLVAAEKGGYRGARQWVDAEFPGFDWSTKAWEPTRKFEKLMETRRVPYNTSSVFDLLQMVGNAARHCAIAVSRNMDTSVFRIFMDGGGYPILRTLITKHYYKFPEPGSLLLALNG